LHQRLALFRQSQFVEKEKGVLMGISGKYAWRHVLLAMIAILSLAAVSSAQQTDESSSNPKIKIKNFGRMDDRFFRGAQPKEKDYKDLAQLGIKTIIDLREDPEEYSNPMIAKKYPTAEATETFLKTVNDPATGKFYVHCAGGRHRTGAMGALYRFEFYNWNFDQVYKEMKQYDFYTSWGHGAFKDFVENLYTHKQHAKANEK
jgi:protein tyrosine/serine phosphatase